MTAAALPADTPAVAADKAWRRVCLAIDRNLPVEAGRWLRVLEAIQKLIRTAPAAADTPARSASPAVAPCAKWEKVESVFADSHPNERSAASMAVPATPRPP